MSYAQSQHILMHKPWSQMHARTKWYTRLDTHTLTQGAMKLKNRAFTGACRWHGKGGGVTLAVRWPLFARLLQCA